MKIWHLVSELPIPGELAGGMGVHVYNLVREQAKLGHDVTVWCPIECDREVEGFLVRRTERKLPYSQGQLSGQLLATIHDARRIKRAADSEGSPDIFHVHEWDMAETGVLLRDFTHWTTVMTLHISNVLNQRFMSPKWDEVEAYYLWWEKEMLFQCDGVIAISDYFRNYFINICQCTCPVRTIHNGVNVSDFQNGVVKEKPDSRLLAFFHGRLVGQKGIDIIIEAANKADDILWVLAGEVTGAVHGGYYEDGLLTQLRGLEREGKVMLPGMIPQTEIGAWLRCCDVAVYPHKRAPFDCAVLEAMACGARVVTTCVDAIGEYAGKNTVRVIEPTAESLLAAVSEAPDHERAARGQFRASGFTWERTAKETLNYYEEIINGNKDNTEHHAAA